MYILPYFEQLDLFNFLSIVNNAGISMGVKCLLNILTAFVKKKKSLTSYPLEVSINLAMYIPYVSSYFQKDMDFIVKELRLYTLT